VPDLPHPLKPKIVVQDSVHGRIWLTEIERDVVATALFQRLRRIEQLGLGSFVFPTATHTRFAHSLGAMHVMGLMLSQPSLRDHYRDREERIQELRLAALLHDVGHYPFSHLGENVWPQVANIPDGEDVFKAAAALKPPRSGGHERLTSKIIRETEIGAKIDDALSPVEGRSSSEIIADLISGEDVDVVGTNLVSSDLDCDRLDYLVRDSMGAGLSYGQVDLQYLIETLIVANDERRGKMLAVEARHGARALEHFILARYFHYARFVTHKTIAAAELLLAVALIELIRTGLLPSYDEVSASIGTEKFLGLVDGRIWTAMTEVASAPAGHPKSLVEAANRLLRRSLLKCAYESQRLSDEPVSDIERDYVRRPDRIAREAEVPLDSFCLRSTRLRLVSLKGLVSPHDADAVNQYPKAAKIADEDGAPPRLLSEEGIVAELPGDLRTVQLFVREPAVQRTFRDRLKRYLADEYPR
jgi:HD superfamily phosphohydrolase